MQQAHSSYFAAVCCLLLLVVVSESARLASLTSKALADPVLTPRLEEDNDNMAIFDKLVSKYVDHIVEQKQRRGPDFSYSLIEVDATTYVEQEALMLAKTKVKIYQPILMGIDALLKVVTWAYDLKLTREEDNQQQLFEMGIVMYKEKLCGQMRRTANAVTALVREIEEIPLETYGNRPFKDVFCSATKFKRFSVCGSMEKRAKDLLASINSRCPTTVEEIEAAEIAKDKKYNQEMWRRTRNDFEEFKENKYSISFNPDEPDVEYLKKDLTKTDKWTKENLDEITNAATAIVGKDIAALGVLEAKVTKTKADEDEMINLKTSIGDAFSRTVVDVADMKSLNILSIIPFDLVEALPFGIGTTATVFSYLIQGKYLKGLGHAGKAALGGALDAVACVSTIASIGTSIYQIAHRYDVHLDKMQRIINDDVITKMDFGYPACRSTAEVVFKLAKIRIPGLEKSLQGEVDTKLKSFVKLMPKMCLDILNWEKPIGDQQSLTEYISTLPSRSQGKHPITHISMVGFFDGSEPTCLDGQDPVRPLLQTDDKETIRDPRLLWGLTLSKKEHMFGQLCFKRDPNVAPIVAIGIHDVALNVIGFRPIPTPENGAEVCWRSENDRGNRFVWIRRSWWEAPIVDMFLTTRPKSGFDANNQPLEKLSRYVTTTNLGTKIPSSYRWMLQSNLNECAKDNEVFDIGSRLLSVTGIISRSFSNFAAHLVVEKSTALFKEDIEEALKEL